nr:hypothetical protein CDS [Bradyrhizobium sp.]
MSILWGQLASHTFRLHTSNDERPQLELKLRKLAEHVYDDHCLRLGALKGTDSK